MDADANTIYILQEDVSDGPVTQQVNWTTNKTKTLIHYYSEYKPKLGTQEIKNMKKLWEVISDKMDGPSPAQCENKWRVLERAYKKHIDNQNSTGQGKKYFEYLEEMNNIFKGKRNVKPVILLSSSIVDTTGAEEMSVVDTNDETLSNPLPLSSSMQTLKVLKRKRTQKNNPILNKNIILENMRKDRKEYYAQRLNIEKEKLILLKERNDILKVKSVSITK